MSDLELTMMRRVGELNKENARLKEAIADSYKAVDEMEKRFKELEAEFEMHPMAVENARLKAEVERLTKAGDELERVLTSKMSSYEVGNASFQWRAAKEGKGQP